MHMHEQWWFQLHCTSHWGQETPLSEHVYCVAIAFKMTERLEQWICIKVCDKLEHSSMETTQMIHKAAWATDNWQLPHDNVPSYAPRLMQSFLAKPQIIQVTQLPLQPRFSTLRHLTFPQTKITFEREEISDHEWDSGKYNRAAMAIGRSMWGRKVLLWRELRYHCPMYNVSYILYFLQ